MAKMHDAFNFPMVPKGDKNILNFAAKKNNHTPKRKFFIACPWTQ